MTVQRDSAGRIVTDRLRLRQWLDTDRVPFAAMGRDPRVMAHFPSLLFDAESDELLNHFGRAIEASGSGMWALERLSDRAFIGFCGIQPVAIGSPVDGEVEIGWRLARNYWGQGYASEAARAALVLAFGEQSLTRVLAITVPANAPSIAVMQRLGMSRRPERDFDHPGLPSGHPLRPHIVHEIAA